MVGGGAVNFHGYQRSSSDVDFWIDTSPHNLKQLIKVLQDCGYDIETFPEAVIKGEQNISIKISPIAEIELITRFDPGKSFEQAFIDAELAEVDGLPLLKYRVLSYFDLIQSKLKSQRAKDMLDVQELTRLRSMEEE